MSSPARPAGSSHELRGRVPDFFIVGHHKCGTTALYEMLRQHPSIFMPDLKEPRYFATDLRRRFQPAGRESVFPETLEDYLALFAPAAEGQITGEASPSYLRSFEAAGNIAELQPGARIIAILREPASLVRSLHLQLVQDRVETENDLARAIAGEDIRTKGLAEASASEHVLRYSDHVRFVEQLRRYHELFGREQVLVLIYDDFRADNQATVRRVFGFLGVDADFEIQPLHANPTVRVRSVGLNRALHRDDQATAILRRAAKRALPAPLRERALGLVQGRLLQAPAAGPPEAVMAELRRRYRPEVEAISDYLGRDLLSEWNYDARP